MMANDNARPRNVRAQGSALVEGALSLLIFVLILFGIMDLGRMVWAYNQVAHGTHEGVRFAIVHGSSSSSPATQQTLSTFINSRLVGLDPGQITIAVTWTPDNNPGSTVALNVAYSFKPLVPYLPSGGWTLRSRSQGMIAR